MTQLVPQESQSAQLVELARSLVADGTIGAAETPALLRRVAAAELGTEVVLAVAVVAAFPVYALPPDDFALVEYEVRPGVRNYRLARVPKNHPWRIRIGAFERACHRACTLFVRRFRRAVRGTVPLTSVREPAYRLPAPGPSRC